MGISHDNVAHFQANCWFSTGDQDNDISVRQKGCSLCAHEVSKSIASLFDVIPEFISISL
jgi:hypothetical protein